jgi:hypothetical protein
MGHREVAVIGFATNKIWDEYNVQSCKFLYPSTVPVPIPNLAKVGCRPGHILMENIGALLNFSVDYISLEASANPIYQPQRRSYVGTATIDLFYWVPLPLSYLSPVLRQSMTMKFLYCKREDDERRAAFSFLFWTHPFDIPTWALLAVSVGAISILYKGQCQYYLIYV